MSRTRSLGSFSKAPACTQREYSNSGSLTNTYVWTPGGSVGTVKTITDEVTPRYREKRRRGDIILNPMSLHVSEAGHSGGGYVKCGPHPSWGGAYQIISGDIGMAVEKAVGNPYESYDDSSRVASIALVKAYAAMNTSPVLSGEILSDLAGTISMLKRPFRTANELVGKMIRHRNWSTKKKSFTFARANANAWLEYRYGWKPLVGDCKSILQLAQSQSDNYCRRIRVARGSASSDRSLAYDVDHKVFSTNYRTKGTLAWTEKVHAGAGVLYCAVRISRADAVSQALGLNSRALAPTAWEVLPFSFVADWFVNVGDWIDAHSRRSDIEFRGSWCTTVRETVLKTDGGTIQRTLLNPTQTFTGHWNGFFHKETHVQRSVNPVLPSTPVLKMKPLSVPQTFDAISLSLGKINRALKSFRH